MKRFKLFGVILALVFFSLSPAFAQQPAQKMQTEVVKLKYLEPQEVQILLMPYFSKEGRLYWAPTRRELMIITDHPETVQKILAVIKAIDVKPVELLFALQLALGSLSGEEKLDEILKNDPSIKELGSLLKYKGFTLLDSNLIRTVDRQESRIALGKNGELFLSIIPKYAKEENAETIRLDVRLSHIRNVQPSPGSKDTKDYQTLIDTNLILKSGEKTVVGVSKMDGGDKGLILIISEKVIK